MPRWISISMTLRWDEERVTPVTATAKKTLKSNFGHLELSTPRDRHSTFEPQIFPKRSTKTAMLEEAILSLYAKGMTIRDIKATLQDLHHVDVSPSWISKVIDVVNEEVEQWRDIPLEAVYPVVWLDGIVVKVHQDHQVLNKTIYLALAINMEVYKELLGIWIAEHEGASFWARVLTELNNRGVKDVFVFCVEGLTGFPDTIKGVFPKSDMQLCIVHLVRNSLKYVSWKYRKELAHEARYAEVSLTYEGKDISRDIAPYLLNFTYTDNSSDKADDISLTLEDKERLWCSDWFPKKGDKIRASIIIHNWEAENRTESLPCGTFEFDQIECSGPPNQVTIKAASTLVSKPMRQEKHTKAWENVTLSTIAGDAASKSGLALF